MTELTPQEINLGIAELAYPKYRCAQFGESDAINLYTFFNHTNDKNNYVKTVDYCNNWNDLMPLALEHGIEFDTYVDGDGLRYIEAQWWYKHDTDFISVYSDADKNPQLALALCLYKVLLAKKDIT